MTNTKKRKLRISFSIDRETERIIFVLGDIELEGYLKAAIKKISRKEVPKLLTLKIHDLLQKELEQKGLSKKEIEEIFHYDVEIISF